MATEKGTLTAVLILISLFSLEMIPQTPFANVKATVVDNPISQDTTWTVENSPYIITTDIIVNNNATLTIQPGVIVRFDGNFSLTVNGSLSALGTSANPITFTSNKAEPKPGDWNTIKFTGGNNMSFALRDCTIEYALNGVTIQSLQTSTIERSEISNNLVAGVRAIGPTMLEIKENTIQRNGDGIAGIGDTFSGLIAANNSIYFNTRGVYVQANGVASYISGITLVGNNLTYNKYGISFYGGKSPPDYSQLSYITNFAISNNSISFSEYGIYIETRSWGQEYPNTYPYNSENSYIHSGIISNNTLFFNNNGINITSGGAWRRFAYDIVISDNVVASGGHGVYLNAQNFDPAQADVTLTNNVFSANQQGIEIFGTGRSGTAKTNITHNDISYNTYGIAYSFTDGNVANYNDIYRNALYGMQVQNATVNAENNYWGNETGPYHYTNPAGRGNRVNGNGTDLDFTPFVTGPVGTINEAPVAAIGVERRKLPIDESLVIDASVSSDDDHVLWYLFDYGDQRTSGWTTTPTVTHTYSSASMYEIKVLVLDNFGVKSQDTASIVINVTAGPILLVVIVSPNSTLVLRGQNLSIGVRTSDGDFPIPQASIKLSSNSGGTFSKTVGISDAEGYFNCTFIPPAVTEQTILTITANVTKLGYLSAEGQSEIILLTPSKDDSNGTDYTQITTGIAVVAILMLGTVAYLRMKNKAKPRRSVTKENNRKRTRRISRKS